MNLADALALTMLVVLRAEAGEVYHGPKSLGPFVIDNYDLPMKALLELLGGARNPKSENICYESTGQHFFIRVESMGIAPRSAAAVLVSDFRNCFGQLKNSTQSDAKAWKTEKDIGLGSTTSAIEKACGKPSSVENTDSGKGIYYGDSVPVGARTELGDTQWLYSGASDDSRVAIFGIRNSKVAWILISHNE